MLQILLGRPGVAIFLELEDEVGGALKNPVLSYIVIAVGVAAIAASLFFLVQGEHRLRAYGGIGVGAVIIIIGIVALFMRKPKTSAD